MLNYYLRKFKIEMINSSDLTNSKTIISQENTKTYEEGSDIESTLESTM